MTYREYKPTWLQKTLFVDIYARDYNLSDVPMTYMTRKEAFDKRGLTEEQIDEITRLADENRHLRKTSQDQRRLNGALREENNTLRKKLAALVPDY